MTGERPTNPQSLLDVREVVADPGCRAVVDSSSGRTVFVGALVECDRYVQAVDNGHTAPWSATIGYWGGR